VFQRSPACASSPAASVAAIIVQSKTGETPGWHALGLVACVAGLVFVVALYSTPIGFS
jgi:hypothetical protein